MPYYHNKELPLNVQRHLPQHAQDIFRKAFNHAWEQYRDPCQRWMGGTQEEVANRVAWAAVKKKYCKIGDEWVSNEEVFTQQGGDLSYIWRGDQSADKSVH